MESSFNPEQFLGSALTAPLTKRPPVAAGRPFDATIKDVPKIRPWRSEAKGTSGFSADIALEVTLPPEEATRLGQPTVTLTDGVFLDTTDTGGLDMAPGKNRGLRRYYDATGLNKPGTTMQHLAGQRIKVVLKHDIAKDGSGDIYERIEAIAKV